MQHSVSRRSLCLLRDRHGAAQERESLRSGISPMARACKRRGFYRDRRVIRRPELSRAPKAGSQRSLMGSSRAGGVCRARPGAGTNIPSQSPVAPNRRGRSALLNVVDVGQSCAFVRMIRGNARRRHCRTSPRCPSIGSLKVMLTVHSRPQYIMQCSETLQSWGS